MWLSLFDSVGCLLAKALQFPSCPEKYAYTFPDMQFGVYSTISLKKKRGIYKTLTMLNSYNNPLSFLFTLYMEKNQNVLCKHCKMYRFQKNSKIMIKNDCEEVKV